jgi:hypothetical protein
MLHSFKDITQYLPENPGIISYQNFDPGRLACCFRRFNGQNFSSIKLSKQKTIDKR